MDRNTVTATALIALILVGWFLLMPKTPTPAAPSQTDSTITVDAVPTPETSSTTATTTVADSTLGAAGQGTARAVTVQTEFYTAVLSTKGGTLRSFTLKDYQQADRRTPVQLVDTAQAGALGLVFSTPRNRTVDTRTLFFDTPAQGTVVVTGDSLVVPFEAQIGAGRLRFEYVFKKDDYRIGWRVARQNAAAFATADGYDVVWSGAVPFSEATHERHDELMRSGAYGRSGGDVEHIALVSDASATKTLSGQVDWVATKNKYFTAALFPQRPTRGATLEGVRDGAADAPNVTQDYSVRLDMPTLAEGQVDRYGLYLGPMDYFRLRRLDGDLYDMVDFGWDWMETVTRPLTKLVFNPFFQFFGSFMRFGWVLIIFALAIKLVTHPLTRAQSRSMLKMRAVGPRMQVLKERYKDDPQRQQQETMKLYKQAGVNPLGGCLPMLLQYPVLIALYQYIPQSFLLRQERFLWANDLSAPDPILHLPFNVPLYGSYVAGFTLLMGLSMIVQMRIQSRNQPVASPEQEAQMKVMLWMLPLMMFVFFNRAASGLSLYYLCYNVFSAAEQWWIRKTTPELRLDDDDVADAKVVSTAPRSTPPKRKLEALAQAEAAQNGKKK